jgi:uncharacterized linocin/CFP29 family protein
MDYLRRTSAPLSERTWKALDDAVTQAASHVIAGRRVATFIGPKGWDHVGVPLGTTVPCATKEGEATVCVPEIALLSEIRADFRILWAAIEAFERGAPALETRPAEAAASEVAHAEDRLVFYGDPIGTGFLTSKESPRLRLQDWSRSSTLLVDLTKAVAELDAQGINGPYEAVLSPARYYAYLRAVDDSGFPAAHQLGKIVGKVHRSAVIREGGALFSTRGDDFVITVGGDLTVGYHMQDHDAVHFFCVETLAGQTLSPEAVCLLDSETTPERGSGREGRAG